LFLNPWAINKLSPEVLREIDYHELMDDGRVLSTSFGSFQPYVSKTIVLHGKNARELARVQLSQVLGRPPSGP
jgi:hypothetical protein